MKCWWIWKYEHDGDGDLDSGDYNVEYYFLQLTQTCTHKQL